MESNELRAMEDVSSHLSCAERIASRPLLVWINVRLIALITTFCVAVVGLSCSVLHQLRHVNPADAVMSASTLESHDRGKDCPFFAVIFDAGSTGTRIHVFEFHHDCNNKGSPFKVEREIFQEVKPGLSSFAQNPKEAAHSLLPLLELAKQSIPEQFWTHTPLTLKATAGLRLLSDDVAQSILAEIRTLFASSPFLLAGSDSVALMSGNDEGVFAWFTINLLLDRFASNGLDNVDQTLSTAVVLDLGGGSTQITFKPQTDQTFSDSPSTHMKQITMFGQAHDLYSYSYLGFGLLTARLMSLQLNSDERPDRKGSKLRTACMPESFTFKWNFSGHVHSVEGDSGYGFSQCFSEVKRLIRNHKIHQQKELHELDVYLVSYFFDRAFQAEIIGIDGGISVVRSFRLAAEKACARRKFGPEHWQPWQCFDLAYIYGFLTEGYGLPSSKEVYIAGMDLLNPLRNRELGLNTNASALCFEQKAEAALISSSLTVKVCKLPNTTKSAYLLVLSPDGKHIASSHGDHNVYVCDAISGRLVHCFSGHVRTPWALAWGCNDLLASGCLAGQVRVWSLSTGCSELLVVEDHTAIASLAFHPTANLLAVASGHKLLLWDWREKYPFAECSTPNIKERISGTTPTASCSSVDTPPLMPYRCRELLRSRRELITMRSDLSRRHAELLDRYSELLRRYQALRDEYMPLLRRTVGSDLDAAATAQPLSGADANDVNSGATTAVLSNDTTAATTYVASTQAYTAAEGRSIPRPAFGAADNAEITLRAGETARSARNVNFYVADTELVPSYRYMGADHDYFSAANRLQRQLQAHFPDVNENFTPAEIIERRQIRELQRQRDELAGLVMRRQHVNEPPSLANSILDNLQNSLAQQAELPRFARRRPQSIEIIERNSERRQAANFVFGGERETSSSRGTASTTARTSTGGRATMFSDVRSASEQRSSANVSPPTIYPVLGQQRPLTWAQMMLENPSSSDSADRRSIERREQSFRNPFYAAALNANAPAVITPTDAPPSFVPASIDASISDPQIAGTSRHVSRDLANSSQPPLSPICLENLQDATAYARDITEQSMSDFLRHHNESVNRLQRSYSELSASAQRLVRMFQTTYDDMCRLQNEIDQRLGTESQRPSGRLGPARQLLDSLLKMQQILEKNATVKTVPAGQLHTYLTNETAVLLEVYHSLFQHLEGLDFPDESVQQLRDGESQIRQLQERLRVTTMQDTAEMSRIQLGLVNEVQNFQTFVLDWKNMVIERIRDGTFRLPLTADDNVPSHSDSSRRSTLEAVTISASTRVRFNLAPSTDKQKQEHSASSTAISSSSSERQSPSQNAPTLLKRTSESQPSNEGNADNDRSASTSQQQASASSSGTAAHITFFRQPPAKRQRLDASRPDAETHLQHVPSSPEQEVQNDNEVSSVEITFEPFSADTPAAAETNDATVQTLRQRFLRLSRLREEMRLRDLARRGIRNSAGSSTTQEGGNNTRVIQTSGNRISEFNRSQLARRNFRSRRPQPRTEYEHPDLSSNRSPQSLVSPSSSDIFSWERPSLMLQEPFLTEGSILRLERHLNVPALSDDVNDRWRGFYRPAPPPPPPPVPPIPSDFADDFEDEDRESSVDLQRAVNRAIAGAFIGAGDIAVANNILDLTARIQCWPYTPSKLPVLSTHDHIVAQRCKLHNDSSVCVSPCGQFIAAFVAPSGEQRRAMWADTMLQVISLRLSDQGAVIFSKVFGPNAISVSISPTSDHVLVGLASRRYLRDTYSNQTYGQVFRLWHSDEPKSLQSFKSQLVLSLEYSALEDTHDDLLFPGSVQMGIVARNLSLNCVVWLPVGQGFVYATNKGRICTVTPSVPRRVTPRRSFAPGASIARRILAAASGSESDDEFDSDD